MSKNNDIRIVCDVILQNWENHNTTGGYLCNYCNGHIRSNSKPTKIYGGFNHQIDCPVFVAEDLLTNLK